ncbi:glycosyltransferase involved in cell wall biosynthesis [Branchiibius hedensis]|uniref:D-inositol 3-phosphate glycosyltransferase n=2 Tax=Branchiibius hedensis TaxID=672460 RepID=A0A2Y8ZNZ6_9MICO|nr:glycosyltransferase involved in cell wall biosynthesis [Branchiibius hedensis]SSA34091.1 Glycosyltransferase involved in cell wall bisynthesis [Branchiibius hedensis]
MSRRLLWVSLPDQRARRELYWMSRMPGTSVTALARQEPVGDIEWVPTTYRRPIKRFIEAGAFAWARGLDRQDPGAYDWVASLELCSLVTGQASRWRRAGRPLQAVITWENLPDQPLYKIPPYRQAVNSCRDADLLLCMVDAARDHLLANGFDDERIRVVKPGVDTELFTPAAAPAADPQVVFISPLEPNKGIDRVLHAMTIVRRTVPEASLIVAGSGSLQPMVEAAVADPLQRVTLTGYLDAAAVADLLRSSAVFTTAPRPTWKWTEQLGLAYLEAQACGLPVVTTRCGTNDEAVRAPNLLVDDDAEALAEGLLDFLTDPARRAEVGAANRVRMVAEHDLSTQCARMGAAFADIEAQQ